MATFDAARRATAAGLLLFSCACSPRDASRARHNLVLITLDTTRADRIGCYGSKKVATPNIDRIAKSGTVFERAFAVAPITGTSHTSILSGTFPPFHQVRDNDVYRVPPELPWLPSILKANGYTTAGIVAAFPLRAGVGFGRGFDYFGDHLEAPPGSLVRTAVQTVGVASRKGDRVAREFRMWLEKNGSREPFFAWVHFYDPHFPYEPPQRSGDINSPESYDGEVAFVDDCVGSVVGALESAGLGKSTGIVVVADHGEGLMDHGEETHGLLLYNSTLHVPLIVRLPWLESQRPRTDAYASGADVTPTILEALGVAPDVAARMQGRSLLPLLSPKCKPEVAAGYARRPLYFETLYPRHNYRWSPMLGFIMEGRKYIHAPRDELYDLETDMAETRDLAASGQMASMAARFRSLLPELRRGRPSMVRHDPSREEIARLRSLGYLGGGSAVDDDEPVDDLSRFASPKDRMAIFFRFNEILGLAMQNKVRQAYEEARLAAAADAENKTARLMVATFADVLGFREIADGTWDELVRRFPDKDVLFAAGSHFLSRGNLVRARSCFERLVAADPRDFEAVTRLGDVASAEKDHRGARALYEQALRVDPGYREALLGLAVSLDRVGEPEAAKRFAIVADRYPFDPEVSFDYGVYLLRHGREAEAPEYLRRAAAMADGPPFAQAQFALAAWYRQTGEIQKARACLHEVELHTPSPDALARARQMLAEMESR